MKHRILTGYIVNTKAMVSQGYRNNEFHQKCQDGLFIGRKSGGEPIVLEVRNRPRERMNLTRGRRH